MCFFCSLNSLQKQLMTWSDIDKTEMVFYEGKCEKLKTIFFTIHNKLNSSYQILTSFNSRLMAPDGFAKADSDNFSGLSDVCAEDWTKVYEKSTTISVKTFHHGVQHFPDCCFNCHRCWGSSNLHKKIFTTCFIFFHRCKETGLLLKIPGDAWRL